MTYCGQGPRLIPSSAIPALSHSLSSLAAIVPKNWAGKPRWASTVALLLALPPRTCTSEIMSILCYLFKSLFKSKIMRSFVPLFTFHHYHTTQIDEYLLGWNSIMNLDSGLNV